MRKLLGILVAVFGLATAAGTFLFPEASVHANGLPSLPNPPPQESLCAGWSPVVVTMSATLQGEQKCVPI